MQRIAVEGRKRGMRRRQEDLSAGMRGGDNMLHARLSHGKVASANSTHTKKGEFQRMVGWMWSLNAQKRVRVSAHTKNITGKMVVSVLAV